MPLQRFNRSYSVLSKKPVFISAKSHTQQPKQFDRMAKTTFFKAYDLQRKKQHTITTPTKPAKITSYRLDRQDWAITKTSTRKSISRRAKMKAEAKRTPKAILDVLGYDRPDWHCRQCGKGGDDVGCSEDCYKNFK
ncbi:hypothetical protein LTR37_012177 [Vermiconidia calcicola]|uniref:Uncharacterized protein n=1 Tax=Vermiconidia calcicola TaxID=1690605 RepID=A0ACC3MZY4_9PEZI|nr:hypothetical protein LTR37_012177 [Vermiconidia calcicola]